jgi:hypothetical protein
MMKKTAKTLKGDSQDNDKHMTLRQVAEATGASYRAVADYAQKAGWTKNGKRTLLDERQITVILEAMKRGNSNQYNLARSLQGIDTSKSRVFRVDLLHRQIEAEMQSEIDELERENAGLRKELTGTRLLPDARTEGLQMIQRIAEAGGLVMSDRDDTAATYRRR